MADAKTFNDSSSRDYYRTCSIQNGGSVAHVSVFILFNNAPPIISLICEISSPNALDTKSTLFWIKNNELGSIIMMHFLCT